jgi:hypothetical protein
MIAERSTSQHESAHAAAAIWFGGRRVDCVRVDHPEVNVAGKMSSTLQRELGPQDLVVHLIGWLASGDHPNWPPTWPVAEDETDASASSSASSTSMRRLTASASCSPSSCSPPRSSGP